MTVKLPSTKVPLPDPIEIEDPNNRTSFERIRKYVDRLNIALTRAFDERATKLEPVTQVLLLSPNGSVFTITVTDAGAITATKIHG